MLIKKMGRLKILNSNNLQISKLQQNYWKNPYYLVNFDIEKTKHSLKRNYCIVKKFDMFKFLNN